ncbi:MAG TPA: hypothetical protein VF220_01830 [Nitrososphaeraceae archaeon]
MKIKHSLSNVDRMIERSPSKQERKTSDFLIEKITGDPQFFDYYLYSIIE